MRRVVGWLCFASFMSALAFAGYYVFVVMAPFFMGGEVRDFGWQSKGAAPGLGHQLGANGLSKSDSTLLRGDVLQGNRYHVYRTWEAWEQLIDTWSTPKVDQLGTDKVWAGAADMNGKVVAAYPYKLTKTMSRVVQPTDSGWRGAIGPGQSSTDGIYVRPVIDAKGRQIGSFAVAWRPYEHVAVVPTRMSGDYRSAAMIALVSALLFIILLPFWVAMDADWRGMRGGAWAVLVVVTGAIGFAAYLIARLAPPRQCPNCGEMVHSGYKRCPACGVSLLAKCPKCGRRMGPGWQYCPKCSGEQREESAQTEPVQAPEAEPAEPVSVRLEPDGSDALPIASHFALGVNVADAGTGAPVGGAIVTIDGVTTVEGRTGEKGYFEARTLLGGAYTVSVSARNYEPAEAQVEVGLEERSSVRLALNPQPGAISGRVLDRPSARPISGARVYVDSTRLERSVMTDRDGVFVLGGIPPGPYTVCAEIEGYARQSRLAEVEPGEHATVGFALEAMEQEVNADAVQ